MVKKLINDIKANWLADLMFLACGAAMGLALKFLWDNVVSKITF